MKEIEYSNNKSVVIETKESVFYLYMLHIHTNMYVNMALIFVYRNKFFLNNLVFDKKRAKNSCDNFQCPLLWFYRDK